MKAQLHLLVIALLAPLYLASPVVDGLPSLSQREACNCAGTTNGGEASESYICGDARLGPKVLPGKLPLGTFVSDYDRFGGLNPGDFLKKWTAADGSYVYPPQNGFQLDTNGNLISGTMILQTGTLVDRFGSEYGMLTVLRRSMTGSSDRLNRILCFCCRCTIFATCSPTLQP